MQLFNEINSRKLKGERNVFLGIFTNHLFCTIWFVTATLQVLIIQFGSVAMSVAKGGLDLKLWGICLAFGFGSLPMQQVINLTYWLVQRYQVVRDLNGIRRNHHKTFPMMYSSRNDHSARLHLENIRRDSLQIQLLPSKS